MANLHEEVIELSSKLHPRWSSSDDHKVQQALPFLVRGLQLSGQLKVGEDLVANGSGIGNLLEGKDRQGYRLSLHISELQTMLSYTPIRKERFD